MFRRVVGVFSITVLALASCTRSGGWRNPLVAEAPFVATAVPADFAVVVDELHTTFYTRQHVQQVITAADGLSRTTYARIREFTNTPAEPYSQETPLTPSQVQAMWNTVSRNELMTSGSRFWVNWRADSDVYKENTYTIQIRANGETRSYRQVNGFPKQVRPLVLLVNAVRLPMSIETATPVVGAEKNEEPVVAPVVTTLPTTVTTLPSTVTTLPATVPGAQP